MDDPEVLTIDHCSRIMELGIKRRVNDADFLNGLFDLMKIKGTTFTLGKSLIRAVPYFLSSIKYNLGGSNADGKV